MITKNNMKHLLYTAAILLMAAACTNEEMEQATTTKGKAAIQFAVSTSECPVQMTRATAIPDVKTFTVHITGGTDVDITKTLEELQNERPLYLEAGENGTAYTVEAYSCDLDDLEPAVLDKPCFYAQKDTIVLPDETVKVSLVCSLQQFQVSFEPSETFTSAFRSDEMVEAQGGKEFSLVVSDENNNSVTYTLADLAKSAYFHTTSPYIKIHVTGTTIKGFPVDYTETIEPEDGLLEAKDHLIIGLDVKAAETKSFHLKAMKIEL